LAHAFRFGTPQTEIPRLPFAPAAITGRWIFARLLASDQQTIN